MKRILALLAFLPLAAVADTWTPASGATSIVPSSQKYIYTFTTGENGGSTPTMNQCRSLAIEFDNATGGAGTVEGCSDGSCTASVTIATLTDTMNPGPYVSAMPYLRINRDDPTAGTAQVFIRCADNLARGVVGVTDGDKGDITVASSGTNWQLDAGVVGANELDEAGVEAGLEAVLDLPDLQSAVTDAQVPDTITIDESTLDDDLLPFDDADGVWTATVLGQALEELNDSINAGVPNGAGAKTHWSQLLGVPAGFADGIDDGGGGGGDNVQVDGVASVDPDLRSDGDSDAIRCTGAGVPDASCAAAEDVIWRHNTGSVTATHLAANSITAADAAADMATQAELDAKSAASSTDNAIARFDSTAGDLQNSGVTIDDSNNMDGIVALDADGAITGTTIAADPAATPTMRLEDSNAPADTDGDNDAGIISADMTDVTADSTDSKIEMSVQVNDVVTEIAQIDGTGLTVVGTAAATTVTGANVTSGANPGHTHDGTSISALDAGDTTTGAFADARVDGSLESDEVTGLTDAQISDTLTASTSTTAAANDSDTSIATTAFVQQEIDDGDLLTDNCVLENDGTPIPDSCVGDGVDGGGAALPVVDTTSIAEGSVDNTKEVRFEVDGLTTGTVRVLTMPDADVNLGALAASNLATDSVSADELNATGVESELETALDIAGEVASTGMAGTVIADSLTVDLWTLGSPTFTTLADFPTVTAFPGTPPTGAVVIVTDDSAIGACDSAAGSARSLCWYNGSAWQSLGDGGGGGGFTSFNIDGDNNSPQTITDGNEALIAGGTNGIDTTASATDTVTIDLDWTEVAANAIATSKLDTEVRSLVWNAGALNADNTECASPSEVSITSGPRFFTVPCTMGSTETDGFIYGNTNLPDSINIAADVTFEVSARVVTDNAGATSHGYIEIQCVAPDATVGSTWSSGTDLDVTQAAGDVADDIIHDTSAAVDLAQGANPDCAGGDVMFWRYKVCDTDATPSTGCTSSAGAENDHQFVAFKMEWTSDIGD